MSQQQALFLLSQALPESTTKDGILNLYGIDPFTLDPALSSEMNSHGYIIQLFSGLVRLDDNLQPVPDVAREWQVSDDGKTYTFYLRDDVRFHDGRQVKAGDFKYSWLRACRPETGSATAATYLGDIVGVRQVLNGESHEISGVVAIDDYTLQITLDADRDYFLYKLTYPTSFVVDEANVRQGQNWWHSPNGTGPFRLESWAANTLLVLKRNELYYGKQANVDSVIFHLWGGIPMNMYETGDIDATLASLYDIDKITDKNGSFYEELTVVPELSLSYIGFNTNKPPFDDIDLRRAFCLAVDKDKLASLVFKDTVQPTDGILPPGMPGFNNDLRGLGYNLNEAKALITASRYRDVSNLPPITITTSGWGGLISSALEAIIYDWGQNLGVEVKVRQLEPERFNYYLKQEKDEMFYTGWIADYPHPQNFLEVLFQSGAEYNYGGYSNAKVDSLLETAATELDTDLSMALYQQAEQVVVDDAACIPLWSGKNYVLVKPYVKGYNLGLQGLVMLNSVSIEPH